MPVADLLHLIPPDGIGGTSRPDIVEDMAVSAGDNSGIIGALGPALDLQAAEARLRQIVQVIDHAHIPGVHDIGPRPVLEYREIFPGPFFLHKVVLIAAGLGAGAPVAVPPGHIVREQAPPAVADAHGPVNKGLQLQILRRFGPDRPNLLQTQLPGQDDPLRPQVVPRPGGGIVCHADLGGDVALTPGGVPPRQGEGPQIRRNQRIHPHAVQKFQPFRHLFHLPVPGHGVHRHVNPDSTAVGKFHSLQKFFPGEIPREGAHPEALSCQVHCVRAVEYRHPQPLHVPGGTQQLRLFSLTHIP